MTKIIISERFGGFGLSDVGEARLRELGWDGNRSREVGRDDSRLVQVVEEMGAAAGSAFASLSVVEIPDGIRWHIYEYDGYETVHEAHRSWTSDGEEQECS